MMELVYDVTDRVPEHLGRNFHLALELRVKARYRPRAKLDVKDAEFIVKLTQEFNLLAKEELEG
jgi:hypothetical protein